MEKNTTKIYWNEFFEGDPRLEEPYKTFSEKPMLKNLTKNDIWVDKAKFYFLPFLVQCYRFTRHNKLPHFAIPVSPTCMFHRDRLHLRNFMDTIHQAFFRCLEMCIPKDEPIMLLVEKRFHIDNPVDGGTQQLYNMLWEYDIEPEAEKCILPPNAGSKPRLGINTNVPVETTTAWGLNDLNPSVPEAGVDLSRKTLWLEDDLNFLCKRYDLEDEYVSTEVMDISKVPDEKKELYEKSAREFHFKVFEPKYIDEDVDIISSDSDLDDLDDLDVRDHRRHRDPGEEPQLPKKLVNKQQCAEINQENQYPKQFVAHNQLVIICLKKPECHWRLYQA